MSMDHRAVLDDCPLLRGFSDEERNTMFNQARIRTFNAGQYIYRDQDPQTHLTLIGAGTVVFSSLGFAGKEVVMAIQEAGSWFGEALCDPPPPRIMHISARTPVSLVEIPSLLFRDLLRQNGDAALIVLDNLGRRFWAMKTLFQDDVVHPTMIRLLRRLLVMREFKTGERGRDAITFHLTQGDLAQMLGMTRQGLRPVVRQLEATGLVEFGYGTAHLPSIGRIRDYLEQELKVSLPDYAQLS